MIDAIDGLKAIDPGCGSGAFPMGMLQKFAYFWKKLDPENEGWRMRQEKAARAIESSATRDEEVKAIQRAFARNNDDYGRKLYLIENCLYVYFFERSLQLLHPGGLLSFITSNKYFSAVYGERLRTYLAYATRPRVMLDFGDAPVFTSIAYPAILV